MENKSLSLQYVVRNSSLSSNAPLLIMLHGYGSDENDLFSFASDLPEELLIISVKAPYPMQPYGNAWYEINFDNEKGKWSNNDQAKESRNLIATFIDEAADKYAVNKNNISLLGFSQGCILSIAVALSFPEKIKNIIGLSGYVNQDIIVDNFKEKDFSNLDFYCSHGTLDQVIPVQWAQQTPLLLNQFNIKNSYSEFAVGHGVSPQNFNELKTWLAARI